MYHLNTPVRRWLRGSADRCPGCGFHVPTQGHCCDCPFGLRSWCRLDADGVYRMGAHHAPKRPR